MAHSIEHKNMLTNIFLCNTFILKLQPNQIHLEVASKLNNQMAFISFYSSMILSTFFHNHSHLRGNVLIINYISNFTGEGGGGYKMLQCI